MKTRRSCKRSRAHTTLSNDATVRAPSDNTLTNSQRTLRIAVHRLSAVTSICPLVDCAPLRHIWVGTYGQRVCLQVLRPSSSSCLIFEAQFLAFSLPPKDEAKLLTWDSKFIWLRSVSTRKPIRLPPRRKRFSIQSLALRNCSQDVSSIAFAPVSELTRRCSSATCSLRFSIEEALLWAGLLVGHFGGDLLSQKQALS